MCLIKNKVAVIFSLIILTFSSEFVFALSCSSSSAKPALDDKGLLPPKHNPASVPPINNPDTKNSEEWVTSVSMGSETCAAIRLFDASPESERHYDLINCLDGLTFGFGNWPQSELGEFFGELIKVTSAEKALVERFVEVFKSNTIAWSSFREHGGISNIIDTENVRTGIKNLLLSSKMKNVRGLKNRSSDGTCVGNIPIGKSFYFDHAKWLVPTVEYAFRDPAVVAFQVSHWEADVLSKAKKYAELLRLPKEGIFLMAFYESNPGQVPFLTTAINEKMMPKTLHAGGKFWQWDGSDRPSALSGISLERWRTLLLWQAMCPFPNKNNNIRIRNRNLKFFSEYLASDFKVPTEAQTGKPSASDPKNCDPGLVKMRH